MSRKMFLASAVLFCLPVLAAAEQKPAQPSADTAKQTQSYEQAGMNSDAVVNAGKCEPQSGKEVNPKQAEREGDPEAPQNQVEYGGGG